MTPHYADDWLTIFGGDCRTILAELPEASVDCVVTSPPYWGLRDYGTAEWLGGDELHDHRGSVVRTTVPVMASPKQRANRGSHGVRSGDCECGAVRVDSQIGLEPSPESYVAALVDVFREVWRVLKPSGTVWLNLGDTYAANRTWQADQTIATTPNGYEAGSRVPPGLKSKDLVGIPWRVAFALQAAGWYLRSDVIWAKPNPMPESVTDRPTKAHEYVFMLTKAPRYYFDSFAVREPISESMQRAIDRGPRAAAGQNMERYATWQARSDLFGGDSANALFASADGLSRAAAGRNVRTVWTMAPQPYPGTHFAVFPPELPERCIKASSSEHGVCPECGTPWVRQVELERVPRPERLWTAKENPDRQDEGHPETKWTRATSTGWAAGCPHGLDPVPATILDPFGGTGTVGLAANRLSRRAILVDLNPTYLRQSLTRAAQTPLGL